MAEHYFPSKLSVRYGSLVKKAQFVGVMTAGLFVCLSSSPVSGQTIVDEWNKVQAPKPPELKSVKIDDPKTTAFLVLDIIKQGCNNDRRPRCVVSVPKIQSLASQVRAKGASVIYSITPTATPADIIKEVAPLEGETMVKANSDKFLGTDLEKILRDKGIKTVIIVGTAAHGAVLYTGSQAAFRGFKVIIPVDGMTSENTYFEQYTAYQLANVPGAGQQVTLTKFDMIQF